MKRTMHKYSLTAFIWVISLALATTANAQQKLIYYWNFNNFTGIGAAVPVVTSPLTPIHASWSSLDSTKALISYVPVSANVSKNYLTYWDANTGDTMNGRRGASGGNSLRVRNPSDSMQLLFTIPSSHYKNITIKFETQKSSTTSGQGQQLFSYSTDGGISWKASGLSVLKDSLPDKNWGLVTVNIKNDVDANNNNKLIFRIIFNLLTTGTSGNNRFDNLTVEGDTFVTAPRLPLYKIRQIRSQNAITGVADSVNKAKGYIKGTVESTSFSKTALQFSLRDSTGAITVYSTVKNYVPVVGDSIEVHGYTTQYQGVTEYTTDSIIYQNTGNKIETPAVVATMSEATESHLVKINGLRIYSGWGTGSSGYTVNCTNNIDTVQLYVTSATNLFGTPSPAGYFNVSGIVSQYKSSSPYIGGYQLEPRSTADIQLIPSSKPLYTIGAVRIQDPVTGVADSVNKAKGFIKGVVMSPSFSKTYLSFSLVDNTGAITVYSSTVKNYTPAIGDSIIAHGYITQYNGLTEYTTDSIAVLPKGTGLETPTIVTAMSETYESHVVEIKNVHVISGWSGTTSYTVNVTNGPDTFQLYITAATGIIGTGVPVGNFNVFGIESQYKSSSPYIGGYQLQPRFIADLQLIPAILPKPLYTIAQVRLQDAVTGVSDSLNKAKGYIKGVVMSPSFSKTYLSFSLVDNTGAITVYSATVKNYTPAIGDSIIAHGYITQYNGLTEYTTDSIAILSKGSSLETPNIVTAMSEAYESHVVEIKNVHIISGWSGTTSYTVNVTNGPDTFQLYITSATGIIGTTAPVGNFNVFGIESQYKSSSPYIGGYQLEPRFIADIQLIQSVLPKPLYTIAQVRPEDAVTGISDSLNKAKGYIKGVVMSPSFSKTYLSFSLVDNTGAITVYSATVKNYTPAIGDSIIAHGYVTQYNGLTEYTTDSIAILPNGTSLEAPNVVTAMSEAYESHVVEIKNVHVISGWGTGANYTVSITNGPDTFTMFVYAGTNIYGTSAPIGNFNLFGIESQYKSSSPYIGGYEIDPRSLADIQLIAVSVIKPIYTIAQVRPQDANGVADSLNKAKGYIKGVVVSPTYSTSYLQFSLVDNTGAITIYTSTVKNYTPKVGDSIMAHGYVTQFDGVTEYTTDSIIALPKGTLVETPSVLTTFDEAHESHLVKVLKVHLVDPTQWVATGTGFNVSITDGQDTFSMRITSAVDLFKKAPIKGNFNVTGVETQFKSSTPYLGGYQIEPRGQYDIQPIPLKLYTISQVRPYNTTTGIADSINLSCLLKGVVNSSNLSGNASQFFSLIDNTGAITVIANAAVNGYNPNVGDSILVRGIVAQNAGLTEFIIDSVKTLAAGTPKNPVVATTLDETTESQVVLFKGYHLVDPTQWNTSNAVNGRFVVKAYNGSDSLAIAIVQGTNLFSNSALPTTNFDVTGIGSQNDMSSPFLQNYILIPRDMNDFEHASSIDPQESNSGFVNIYPNPTTSFTNVEANFNITKIQVIDIIGNVVVEQFNTGLSTRIDMAALKTGVYFIKISDGNNLIVRKIIKD